jgi:hypothetical protein
MFQRVPDIFPAVLVEELIRLARMDRDWVDIQMVDGDVSYQAKPKYPTWLRRVMNTGADVFGIWASSRWLIDGPKVFRPTVMQCQAMEQIEVKLLFEEYSQPYPALLVDLPPGVYEPFHSVLAFQSKDILVFTLLSRDHLNDVTTTVSRLAQKGWIEESLQKFDDSCQDLHGTAGRALRIAANSCLALTNHETSTGFLFPEDVKRDQRLATEKNERGQRARDRLNLHALCIAFKRTVILHKTEGGGESDPTGREVGTHWRRGHWRMTPCGSGRKERRRVLIPPVLVRADKFIGDTANTTTLMRT